MGASPRWLILVSPVACEGGVKGEVYVAGISFQLELQGTDYRYAELLGQGAPFILDVT